MKLVTSLLGVALALPALAQFHADVVAGQIFCHIKLDDYQKEYQQIDDQMYEEKEEELKKNTTSLRKQRETLASQEVQMALVRYQGYLDYYRGEDRKELLYNERQKLSEYFKGVRDDINCVKGPDGVWVGKYNWGRQHPEGPVCKKWIGNTFDSIFYPYKITRTKLTRDLKLRTCTKTTLQKINFKTCSTLDLRTGKITSEHLERDKIGAYVVLNRTGEKFYLSGSVEYVKNEILRNYPACTDAMIRRYGLDEDEIGASSQERFRTEEKNEQYQESQDYGLEAAPT